MSGGPLAMVVSPSPGSRVGGVEHHCGLVGDVLRADGWRVEEIGPRYEAGWWAERSGVHHVARSWAALREARTRRPDLIVSNGTLGLGAPRGVPRIHVYHGTMVEHVRRGERSLRPRVFWPHIVGAAAAEAGAAVGATTVAVSDTTAAEVRRWYRERVDAVVPLCVDHEHFRPRDRAAARARFGLPADERLALYVGRLEERKGSDLLDPVCSRAGFTLAVAGPDRPATGHHLGALGHDDLPWAYAAADVLLFPTRYEGFGFIAIEAAACGIPVVTTPTGWAASLCARVPGYAPFVVEPREDLLVAALERIATGAGPPVEAAAALVREEHGLTRWQERWRAVIAGVRRG